MQRDTLADGLICVKFQNGEVDAARGSACATEGSGTLSTLSATSALSGFDFDSLRKAILIYCRQARSACASKALATRPVPPLVQSRLLHVVDDHYFHRPFARFQPQT